jgi:hypothetical protein
MKIIPSAGSGLKSAFSSPFSPFASNLLFFLMKRGRHGDARRRAEEGWNEVFLLSCLYICSLLHVLFIKLQFVALFMSTVLTEDTLCRELKRVARQTTYTKDLSPRGSQRNVVVCVS